MTANRQPVLILGAGINGAAVARELVLNNIPVCVVDTADIASGTTAYSSRLIHGGLRYLEYGDVRLVRESLDERGRLLKLAPHLVRPLKLFIPIKYRATGFWQAAARFFGRSPAANAKSTWRGLWLVRMGLWLYDKYAKDSSLPRHSVHSIGDSHTPLVDNSFRWLCSYHDAQIESPERFVLALLEDARRMAAAQQLWFRVFTYHCAKLQNGQAVISRVGTSETNRFDSEPVTKFEPAAIVNATGAWVDQTLQRLKVSSPQLIGGTKGSHFLTANETLLNLLTDDGVYAEADDGRPFFLLPFGEMTLVGTTDLPFDEKPEDAVASDEEIDYLLASVNSVFPNLNLTKDDVELHYSGVRPLPYTTDATPASVTRRHHIDENPHCPVPLFSLVGGKLTTCRSFAEEAVTKLCDRIGWPVKGNSRDRVIPGGESYPSDEQAVLCKQEQLADQMGYTLRQVQAVWRLCGTCTQSVLSDTAAHGIDKENVTGTSLPIQFVRYVIRNEWVTRLNDLVERRLMLLYKRNLSRPCLRHLAKLLAEEGVIANGEIESEVQDCVERLQSHFGKRVVE